jgi:hypothetical protein
VTLLRDVSAVASKAKGSSALRGGARVGYAFSGFLHLVIAWIAIQVAWSASSRSADQSGALRAVSASSLGRLTLRGAMLGFASLGLWQLAIGFAARRARGTSPWAARAKGSAKAVLYLGLAWTTSSAVQGRPGSSKAQSLDVTAILLQQGGGRLMVALLGLVVIGVGGHHMAKGWARKFLTDLNRNPGSPAVRAGVVGYVAKGVSLALVGAMFVVAAVHDSSRQAAGLDGALRLLGQQAFGPLLLTAVGAGIAAYGFYSFARAKHARV